MKKKTKTITYHNKTKFCKMLKKNTLFTTELRIVNCRVIKKLRH